MAAIVPSAQHRLFRWRMDLAHQWDRVDRLARASPGRSSTRCSTSVRDLGPITAGDLGERVGKKGSWWDWDDGKIALEHLFHHGRRRRTRRRNDFARLYDLPERVPAGGRARGADTVRGGRPQELVDIAGRALGVATLGDLGDYHRQGTAPAEPAVAELVDAGVLLPARVEGWGKPAFVAPRRHAAADGQGAGAAQPVRLAGLEPGAHGAGCSGSSTASRSTPRRRSGCYGYYVLPFLLDGELVGRIDLKADRAAGVLRVQARARRARASTRRPWPPSSPPSCGRWPAGSASIGRRRPTAGTWRRPLRETGVPLARRPLTATAAGYAPARDHRAAALG